MQKVLTRASHCLILFFLLSGPARLCSGYELTELKTFPQPELTSVFTPDSFQHADIDPIPTKVVVTDDAVSVDLMESPVHKVLQEISRQSGIKVRLSPRMESFNVTDRFSALPIEKAFRRLLDGRSYALIYGNINSKESIKEVHVLPSDKPSENISKKKIINNPTKQDLIEILDHISLPDNMKAALRDGATDSKATLRKSLVDNKMEALSKLVENLESLGAADSETTRQLRQQLLLHQSQQ